MERNYSTLSYLRNVWEGLKPALSFSARTIQEWQKWHDELKEKLTELLGGFPEEKCSLNAEIIEEVKMNGYVRQKVVFDTEPGVSVLAYVLIPEGKAEKGKMRALLCSASTATVGERMTFAQ